jgi:hypothetical protein
MTINNSDFDLKSFESYEKSILKKLTLILSNHFENLNQIDLNQIKEKEKEINIYPNFSEIEPISDEEIIILDDELTDTSTAESEVLDGKIFWEHTAAGEATRLGLGTKYLLNLTNYSINDIVEHIQNEEKKEFEKLNLSESEKNEVFLKIEEKISKKLIEDLIGNEHSNLKNISLGNRHMLQLAFDLTKLAQKYDLNPDKVLKTQKNLIILNEETSDKIIKEFIEWNYFGFEPNNTYFMIQKKFHGIHIENGELKFDKSTNNNKKLHNHGQMFMQKSHDNVIFKINSENKFEKIYISSKEISNLLSKQSNLLSYNIEDLNYLNSSIDLPSLSLALKLGAKDYGMVMEIVSNNPIKPQKGGACFFDKKLNKVVMIESNQLANIKNEEIVHLNKNFNHYPNPSKIFNKVKENGLPINFEIKKAFDKYGKEKQYIYPCPVQGDSNFLTNTAFVMRKNLKPISSWKSASTTPAAIKAKWMQDKQKGFDEFIDKIKASDKQKIISQLN